MVNGNPMTAWSARKAVFSLALMSIPAWAYSDCGGTATTWTGTGTDINWTTTGNWSSTSSLCFPNNPADIAIFPSTGQTTVTQNAGVIELDQIQFQVGGYTLNSGTGTNTITFPSASTTPGISISTSATASETINVPLLVNNSATQILINAGSGNTGTLNFGDDVTVTSAGLSIPNQGNPNVVNFNGNLNLNSSTLSSSNATNYASFSSTGTLVNVATALTVGSGNTVTNTNTGNISGGSSGGGTGSEFVGTGIITISGGSVTNSNQGTITTGSSTTTSSTGATLGSRAGLTITSGSLINQNTGAVSGITAGSETNVGGTIAVLGAFNSAGAFSQINSGIITAGAVGCEAFSTGDINITGGTFFIQNQSSITDATGNELVSQGAFTMSAGTYTQINSSSVTTGVSAPSVGIGCNLQATSISVSGGTLTNSNTGAISTTPSATPSTGSVILADTIAISGTAIVTNNASTNSVDANSFGTLIQGGTSINISGNGQLIANNNASNGLQDMVQSNAINVNSGGTLSGTGLYAGANAGSTTPLATTTVTNAGTVEPYSGTTPGTMTINGTYSQTGTLIIDLFNTSTFSQLNVTGSGTTTLGGVLDVDFVAGNTVQSGDSFTIVQAGAANTLSGTFSSYIYNNLPSLLIPNINYTEGLNGNVNLSFTACTQNKTWAGLGTPNDTWSNALNWSPNCIPNGVTDIATFAGSSPLTITQDLGGITLEEISFTNGNYTINGPSPDSITFSNNPSFLTIAPPTTASSLTETINVPVIIDSLSASININSGSGQTGTLTFGGNVTINDGSAPGATLTVTNQGNPLAVNFSGTNLTIDQGVLSNINGSSFSGLTGSTVTVITPVVSVGVNSSLNNENLNSAAISSSGNGAEFFFSNPLTINGGDVTNSNAGAITTSSTGSQIRAPSLSISSGSLINSNSGVITDSSFGSVILLASTLSITGGEVTNLDTGSGSADATSAGSFISAPTISVGSPSGTLLNNDKVQATTITVNSGGTLSGIGTYTASGSVNNGGTVSPFDGTSPGVMTIDGSYTQTGTLLIDLLSTSTFSQLNMTGNGTTTLGGILDVDFLAGNTVQSGDSFTIVQAGPSNTLAGTFSNTVYNNLPSFLSPHINYIEGLNGNVSLLFTSCAGSATWAGLGTPNDIWSDTLNWNPNCVPDGTTDTAAFAGSSPLTITQDVGAITLEEISFTNGDYTINGSSANSITFSNNPSLLTIVPPTTTSSLTETINVPVIIDSLSTSININSGAGQTGTLTFGNDVTINDGSAPGATLTVTNQGNPNVVNFSGTTLTINQGFLSSTNTFSYSAVTGSTVNVTPSVSIGTNSSLENINLNSAAISSGGIGTRLFFDSPLTISGGDVTNSNAGAISTAAFGSQLQASSLSISSGTLTNSNSGAVTDINSIGSEVLLGSTLSITGGQVNNFDTGSVDTTTSIGSLIIAPTIDIGSPSGTLLNNDTVQSTTINVNSGGTLSGTGTYAVSDAVNNGGTVFPFDGTSPGIMTISGSYTQTGTLQVDLLNTSTFSQLNLMGTGATTLGGTLDIDFLAGNTVQAGEAFSVVQTGSTNDLSGTFGTLLFENLPPSLVPHVQYIHGLNGEVLLSFTTTMAGPTLPPSYAGGYLETLLSNINHINSHIGLRCEELRRHLASHKKAAPEPLSPPQKKIATWDWHRWFSAAKPESFSIQHTTSKADNTLAMLPQKKEKVEQLRREVPKEPKEWPGNFYFGATGREGDLHTRDDQPGLSYWSAGALAGFDYAFSQAGLGFIANYERLDAHAHQHWGKITSDELHASLYSTYSPARVPELALNGIVGGGYEWYHIDRNTGTPADKHVATGKPHAIALDALFGIEYALVKRRNKIPTGFELVPMASVQYVYLRADGYKEHHAGIFDMRVEHQKIKSLRSGLGLRLNHTCEGKNVTFVPEIYGEWQREFLNKHRHIRFTPVEFDVSSETLVMPGSGRNIALAGVDLLLTFYKRFGIEGSYEFEYNSLYHDHFAYFGLNVRF